MTFKERCWAYLARRDNRISMLLSTVLIVIEVIMVGVKPSFAFFLLVWFGLYLIPPLFYAVVKIDPRAEDLHDSFLTKSSLPLALAFVFSQALPLLSFFYFSGVMGITYIGILAAFAIGWPLFRRFNLREEVRLRSQAE